MERERERESGRVEGMKSGMEEISSENEE